MKITAIWTSSSALRHITTPCQTEGYTGGRWIFGKGPARHSVAGPKTVIFTFGADGCIGLCGDEFLKFRLSSVKAVDLDRVQAMCSTEPIYLRLAAGLGRKAPAAGSARVFQRSNAPARRTRRHSDAADSKFSPRAKLTNRADERVQHYKYGLLNA